MLASDEAPLSCALRWLRGGVGCLLVALAMCLVPLAAPSQGLGQPQGTNGSFPRGEDSESILFDAPQVVEAASIHALTLRDTPANVTVVTRNQIRKYGYQTLAEVLSNVRGFFITSDAALRFVGVRGFGIPGDYNSRILVMIDGHIMTDNVYEAMYFFGEDFGLDLDLVERIEIVRGPSSSLYGGNGIFATINIVPMAPADLPAARASMSYGSFGRKKASFTTSSYLGHGVNLLLSASAFHSHGREIDEIVPGADRIRAVDAEQGYHTLAMLTWQNWSFIANFNDRRMIVPIGWYQATIGDTGTSTRDARNFVEARWIRPLTDHMELRWRIYYDQFRYRGRYHSQEDDGPWVERDDALGDWLGTRFSVRRRMGRAGDLTVGVQADVDARNAQQTETLLPERNLYRDAEERQARSGVFTQHALPLGRDCMLYTGLRFDANSRHSPFFSPRLAFVWSPGAAISEKLIYGRAFRSPSTFELFYQPNPALEPEVAHTFEFVHEQSLAERVTFTASAYHYRLSGLITGVPATDDTLVYRNELAGRATGWEAELSGQVLSKLELAAGLNMQRMRLRSTAAQPPNSPSVVSFARAALSLWQGRLLLSSTARYLSARNAPAGARIGAYVEVDGTATLQNFVPESDLLIGTRNMGDRVYFDPLSPEHIPGLLPRQGRTFFVKLLWRGKP